jgi:glycyl-tRNA synthetase (class II)
MSFTLYGLGGLRFWTPEEVKRRARIKNTLVDAVETTLLDLNQMWRVLEVDAPLMMPRSAFNSAYDNSDIFLLQDAPGGTEEWALRAETTFGTYEIARQLMLDTSLRAPLCVYQAGKSFRRETNDGASASKHRYNEFYQLEFQCIYGVTTTAPVAETLRTELLDVVSRLTGRQSRLVVSDRLPAYATETIDIELLLDDGEEWREIASTSRRTDFKQIPGMKHEVTVFEIAFGLDRLVVLSQ